jgi:hypothetical protein
MQAEWQSVKAELGWVIPDKAIDAVNRHFNAIGASCTDRKTHDASDASRANGLLIVDELGRLELCKGTGFVSATQLLKRGPTSLYSHALVVARTGLAQLAGEQLSPCWEKTIMISPDNDTQKMLTSLMGG